MLGSDGSYVATAADAACVKSDSTGLVWQMPMNKDSDNNYKVYSPGPAGEGVFREVASTAVTDLGSKCGRSNWRLPTPAEMQATILRDANNDPALDATTNLSYDSAVFTDTATIATAGAGWIPYCTSDATVGVAGQAYAGGETLTLTADAACFVRLVSSAE